MKVYEATVIDKCAGAEPIGYESYVVVFTEDEYRDYHAGGSNLDLLDEALRPFGLTDEDIHYYFTEDEFKPKDGVVETEEFKYLIGKRVA